MPLIALLFEVTKCRRYETYNLYRIAYLQQTLTSAKSKDTSRINKIDRIKVPFILPLSLLALAASLLLSFVYLVPNFDILPSDNSAL